MAPLWTIGHSNRELGVFLGLLEAHAIGRLVDVRRFPASRRYPHFGREPLAQALGAAGVQYAHAPELGGHREPDPHSLNTALADGPLRGYADYMQGAAFERALAELLAGAATARTAVLCAEADPAHCHRGLIADALVARGVAVHHVRSADAALPHRLHARARVAEQRVSYPGPRELFPPHSQPR